MISSSNGMFQETHSFSCSQTRQKCDLISFSNVRALFPPSPLLFLSFSLSAFPQRLQESSSPLNSKAVPSYPTTFSHRLFRSCCAGGLLMEQSELCVLRHGQLMTLAADRPAGLSSCFVFPVSADTRTCLSSSAVSPVLHVCARVGSILLKHAAPASSFLRRVCC